MPTTYDAVQSGGTLVLSRGRPGFGLDLQTSADGTLRVAPYGDEALSFSGVDLIDATAVQASLIAYLAAGPAITVLGSDNYDVLYVMADAGGPGDAGVLLDGRGGDDFISAGQGHDTLRGGDGTDRLYGYGGNDRIGGGTGDDEMQGGDGADSLYGDGGQDTLYGGNGKDLLNGGTGVDFLHAGAGSDRIDGGGGRDRAVFDGNSTDYVITRVDDTTWTVRHIATGDTDRVTDVEALQFEDRGVPLTGLAMYVQRGTLQVEGNAAPSSGGIIRVNANDETHRAQVIDADGHRLGTIKLADAGGYPVQDIDLSAVAGADVSLNWRITSDGGYRAVYGSAEDDAVTLTGIGPRFAGTYVQTGAGDDRIVTTWCEDEIYAEDGNDYINAGTGEDTVYGGTGNDTIDGSAWRGDISGNKEIYGEDGDDLLLWRGGTDGFDFRLDGNGVITVTEAATGQEILLDSVEYISIDGAAPVLLTDLVAGMA